MSVQLPQATSASAPAQLPVVLTLDAEGHITIDNKPMSIDDAEAMVKQRIQETLMLVLSYKPINERLMVK